jgi:hypothetical protein
MLYLSVKFCYSIPYLLKDLNIKFLQSDRYNAEQILRIIFPYFQSTFLYKALELSSKNDITSHAKTCKNDEFWEISSFINYPQVYCPTQFSIQVIPGPVSPEVKRQGSQADHSPPSSADVNNDGVIPQLPRTSSCSGA